MQEKTPKNQKNLAPRETDAMYKRVMRQLSLMDEAEMFGGIKLNPENKWVKLNKLVPWEEFEEKYAENFKSKTGQPAISAKMALGALLIKERYQKMSDGEIVEEIAMNPYLQYFLGMKEYSCDAPFHATMFVRFRKRITPEMLAWVNDRICGRPEETEKASKDDDDNNHENGAGSGGTGHTEESSKDETENNEENDESKNKGTLILDATCTPQAIRYPCDASLLDEARRNLEQTIDILYDNGCGVTKKKPRTYRKKAKHQYDSYSKKRKKKAKDHRNAVRQQLQYVKRNLGYLDAIQKEHPDCTEKLPAWLRERIAVIRDLYKQQDAMYQNRVHRCDDRIVSLSQPWVRPIVRGKLNADTEFGAKVEMSVVNGYLRIEDLRWDAFNESTTLVESAENYRKAYGHYPERILADTIFRTRGNLQFCKEHGIHISGPKLGKRPKDERIYRQQLREEWQESGERGEIERDFGVAKRRYSLGRIVTKLKETSENTIYLSVLSMNLWKKLRLLLRSFLVNGSEYFALVTEFRFAS